MLNKLESQIATFIDTIVVQGDEDDLFASGYLQGHIDLALADAEQHNETSLQQLSVRVEQSLANAIDAGELSPADQQLVRQCWQKIVQQITQ